MTERLKRKARGKGVRSLMEYIVPHSPGRGKVTTYELLFDGRGREGELTLCVFSVDFLSVFAFLTTLNQAMTDCCTGVGWSLLTAVFLLRLGP